MTATRPDPQTDPQPDPVTATLSNTYSNTLLGIPPTPDPSTEQGGPRPSRARHPGGVGQRLGGGAGVLLPGRHQPLYGEQKKKKTAEERATFRPGSARLGQARLEPCVSGWAQEQPRHDALVYLRRWSPPNVQCAVAYVTV